MVAARNPIEIGTTPEALGATRSDITVNPGDVLRWVFVFAGATMVLTAALLALLVDGQARSSLLGGGIAFVANGYSVWRVFAVPADISGEATLVNLYRAEFGKLVITGALCATVFALVDQLAVGGFMPGFLAKMIAATIGAIFAQRNDVGERPAG